MIDISKYPPKWVKLSLINHENKMFQFRGKLIVDDLIESFKQKGQEVAVVIWVRTSGERVLVYGFRRDAAAQALEHESILAIEIPEAEHGYEEMLELRLDENLLKNNYAENDYPAICASQAALGKTVRQIAGRINKSIGTVSNQLMISKLPADIQDGLKSGKVTQKNLIKITGFHPVSGNKEKGCSPVEQGGSDPGHSNQISTENISKLSEILKCEDYKEKLAQFLKELESVSGEVATQASLIDELKTIVSKRNDYLPAEGNKINPNPKTPAGTLKRIPAGLEMRIAVNAKKDTSADISRKIEQSKSNTKYLETLKRELDRANQHGVKDRAAKAANKSKIKSITKPLNSALPDKPPSQADQAQPDGQALPLDAPATEPQEPGNTGPKAD